MGLESLQVATDGVDSGGSHGARQCLRLHQLDLRIAEGKGSLDLALIASLNPGLGDLEALSHRAHHPMETPASGRLTRILPRDVPRPPLPPRAPGLLPGRWNRDLHVIRPGWPREPDDEADRRDPLGRRRPR